MINDSDVAINDHCWALLNGELLVVIKNFANTYGAFYDVCGGWEGSVKARDLELISIIERPPEYKDTLLYYGSEEENE